MMLVAAGAQVLFVPGTFSVGGAGSVASGHCFLLLALPCKPTAVASSPVMETWPNLDVCPGGGGLVSSSFLCTRLSIRFTGRQGPRGSRHLVTVLLTPDLVPSMHLCPQSEPSTVLPGLDGRK